MSLCLGMQRGLHRFAWEGALPESSLRFRDCGPQCQVFQTHPPDEIARNPVLLTLLTLGSRVGAVRRSHMAPSYAYSCPPRAYYVIPSLNELYITCKTSSVVGVL